MRLTAHAEQFSSDAPDLAHGNKTDGSEVEVGALFEKRLTEFLYRPCMAAAFLLDFANFVRLPTGGIAPPFTEFDPSEVEFYVDDATDTVRRLAGSKADAAMKEWAAYQLWVEDEGSLNGKKLAELMCRNERIGNNGKVTRVLQPMSKRIAFAKIWMATVFPQLSKVAVSLLSMHTTACAAERNWSKWGLVYAKNRSRLGRQRAEHMIFLMETLGVTDEESDIVDLS